MNARDSDGNRLVWAAISLLGLICIGFAGWVANSIISIDQRVTKVEDRQETIMRIVFHEDPRKHDRPASSPP